MLSPAHPAEGLMGNAIKGTGSDLQDEETVWTPAAPPPPPPCPPAESRHQGTQRRHRCSAGGTIKADLFTNSVLPALSNVILLQFETFMLKKDSFKSLCCFSVSADIKGIRSETVDRFISNLNNLKC